MAFEEIKSGSFMKWNNVGDEIQGYLISKTQQDNRLNPGTAQWIYSLELTKELVIDGVSIPVGNIIRVGGRSSIDTSLSDIDTGLEILIKYDSDVKSKTAGNNPFKLIKASVDRASRKVETDEINPDDIPF